MVYDLLVQPFIWHQNMLFICACVCVPVGCPQLEPPSTFLKTWNLPNNIHQQSSQDGSEETKPLVLANIRS
jgi:hypothetical protein